MFEPRAAGDDGAGEGSPTYRIGRLQPLELPRIAQLERELFPEPLSLGALVKLACQRNTRYLVARRERRVVGYIGFQLFGPAAHTISMGIDPAHRRQGLATRLQRAADRLAADLGARWFTGEVRLSNRAQLRFLQKMRWRVIGVAPRFFKDGEDAVLVWNLL